MRSLLVALCTVAIAFAQTTPPKRADGVYAEINTNRGKIVVLLEYKKVPLTVTNFVGLAEGTINNKAKPAGKPYYDGILFHRVVPEFVIQAGDPLGNGMGGPGYRFPDEFHPSLRHSMAGILSMANAGPKTNGSQFFITHVPTPWLDNHHTVFGRVVGESDMNVVNSIRQGDRITTITIGGDTSGVMDQSKTLIDQWNKKLDK